MGLFDIIYEEHDGKDVVRITIAGGLEKPYYLKKYGMTEKGCFIRVGSAAEPMPQEMIESLYSRRVRNTIGRMESTRLDLTFEQLKIYYEARNLHLNSSFMQNLELLTPEGKPNRVQVLNDDPIGSGKPGDRHYLKIERRDENNREGGIAWFVFNATDCADATRGIVEVSARIWVSSKNRTRVDIDALDNEPGSFTRRAFNVRFAPDGVVSYYREVENPLPELKLQTDAWQEVHIRADLDAGTFDLTVKGKTATGLRFGTDDVHRIRCIAFAPNSSNTTMYVDWVKIAVTP